MTSETLRLVEANDSISQDLKQAVLAARDYSVASGEYLDGTADLQDCASFDEWVDFEGRGRRAYGDGYMPSTTFLAVATGDDGAERLVGFLDFRHELNDFLFRFGGHIGYSVLPEERRRGYATAMLDEAKAIGHDWGLDRILVTCARDNVASAKVIEANGGALENEVAEDDGTVMKRYWIELGK
ncbi:GNAT family N-acetyltransferase [Bifidobacterium choloepi]|uniref:GNAT family N-acetyltransferase n=1 Tax=Bifidobacterium choloepi TaxID=2614131 RepID=A0A6I5N0K9_9BIFI|nr:GNAT family N-acetyltransferase [Bifidobacterium choloepi]NEG70117.1 GNAT family N-acetyltransferase [Bifidobacterium choloepi]